MLDAAAGALAGAVATAPMSGVMLVAQKVGLMGKQPPQKVTDAALGTAEADPPEPVRRGLALLAHFGVGAAMGAPFAMVLRALPRTVPGEVAGVGYGVGVWAAAYLGLVPALGIMPRADRDRPGRPGSMVLAHAVFGVCLAGVLRALRTGGRSG